MCIVVTAASDARGTVFDAWEPLTGEHSHRTFTKIGGEWYGRVASRLVPRSVAELPQGSRERIEATRKHRGRAVREAHGAILAVCNAIPGIPALPVTRETGEAEVLCWRAGSAREAWRVHCDGRVRKIGG